MRDWNDVPTSRRKMIGGTALAIGGAMLLPGRVWAAGEEIAHTAESIHQEPLFKAARNRIYHVLTDTKQFHEMEMLSGAVKSGMALGNAATAVSAAAGGAFTIYGGHIIGRNIELVPNQRVVQAWRVVNWDPGVYSIVKFELLEHEGGTKIVFDHTGFPGDQGQHLADGWNANYWEPLRKLLG